MCLAGRLLISTAYAANKPQPDHHSPSRLIQTEIKSGHHPNWFIGSWFETFVIISAIRVSPVLSTFQLVVVTLLRLT
jgi:hypothetical protein